MKLHPSGLGYYKSPCGRASAVRVTFQDAFGLVYGEWAARLDGKPLGRGSLRKCRKLVAEAAAQKS